jgi:hypothetical protein
MIFAHSSSPTWSIVPSDSSPPGIVARDPRPYRTTAESRSTDCTRP